MLENTVVIDVDRHWEPPRNPGVLGGDPTERVRNFVSTLAEEVLPELRRSFLGGNIADAFERMGDPLPVKKTAAA